jgi:hypothetical protein
MFWNREQRPSVCIAGCTLAALLAIGAVSAWAGTPPPTFSKNVWPILQRRCVSCHQAGEIAPMPLTSYSEVRPWARAIRQAVLTRAMPPWHAEPNETHSFRNDRSLTQAEIATLQAWVDQGCPQGDPLPKFIPPSPGRSWKLGRPDLIVQVPGFQVPERGPVPYSFLIVPLHFDHDTWVRAAEFRIDHRAVIHHINAFVRSPDSSYLAGFPANTIFVPTVSERGKKRAGERVFERRQLLLGYEPGYAPMPWLDDGAKLVKAGSDLVFEMHYNPNGKSVTDYSEFGLYFAKEPPRERVLAIDTLRDLDLAIPANDPAYLSKTSLTLARPVRLLSIQPHMHVRGKSMQVRAIYPNGQTEVLVSVPKYDFNWQTTYVFQDPVHLPSGTRLESDARFDNSPNNRFNPDPGAMVHWGDQTTDEMHIAFLELVIDANADPETIFKAPPRILGERTSIVKANEKQ